MKDELGERMKAAYEHRTRYYLPRRTYTMIRVDGKSFHTYTKGCSRPFDLDLMADMDATAMAMCEQIAGAQMAFVQSDEISILVTDFETIQTEAWFDGNLQKMASVSAAIATANFNHERLQRHVYTADGLPNKRGMGWQLALFDSRVWTIPSRTEVENYFIWRQQDCCRNSVSMTAQTHISHRRLQGKSTEEMIAMLASEEGVVWSDQPQGFRWGRALVRVETNEPKTFVHKKTGETMVAPAVKRKYWQAVSPNEFTVDREFLRKYIPEQR